MLLSRSSWIPLVVIAVTTVGTAVAEAQDRGASQPSLPKRLVSAADDVSRAELIRPLRCVGLSFRVHTRSRSLGDASCDLAVSSKRAIAEGVAAHIGVSRSDTSNIELAMTGRNLIKDENGTEVESYTSVTLNVRDLNYAVVFKLSKGQPPTVSKTERLHLPLPEK